MEPHCFLIVLGFLMGLAGAQNMSSPSYLITVSKKVRPDIPIKLSVTILKDSPILVVSEIFQNNASLSKSETTIAGGSTVVQVLPAIPENKLASIPNLNLVVKGYLGSLEVFSNSTSLEYDINSLSILLQTDKFIYAPGQSVKIRAVLINLEVKPRSKPINITIQDPKGNKIQQWDNVNMTLGVMAKEFQLSQNPPLGLWIITAKVDGVSQVIYFKVLQFVQPKFQVVVNAPALLFPEDLLNYTVTARYFYGNPVNGNMTVSYSNGSYGTPSFVKPINGKAELSVNVSAAYPELWNLINNAGLIKIMVQVTERLTGVSYNGSALVVILNQRHGLIFQGYPSAIKPSVKYSAQIRVFNINGQPLSAEDQKLSVTLILSQGMPYTLEKPEENLSSTESPVTLPGIKKVEKLLPDLADSMTPLQFEHFSNMMMLIPTERSILPSENQIVETLQLPVPADGIIPFQFELFPNMTMLTLQAQYKNISTSLTLLRDSSPATYMKLKITSSAQVGKPLDMTVESSFPLTTFHYMVLSRGQIISAGMLTSSSFTLSPDVSWAPLARVLVYCFRPEGEFVNDYLDVYFTQVLRNNVSLSWNKAKAEPGESVSLSVSVAEPKSLVGILVVDKASHDLELLNGITEQKVIAELYSSLWDFSVQISADPYNIFTRNGLVVLTDDKRSVLPIIARSVRSVSTSEIDIGPSQSWRSPETWLWLDTNMGDSTTKSIPLTVPDSLTSWVAKAFVISENLGLGIGTPVALNVAKDFFLTLNLPLMTIRNEELMLEINLFNNMDQDVQVEVTVDRNDMFQFLNQGSTAGTLQVSVGGQNTTLVSFPIKATKLGSMKITAKAVGPTVSHSASHTILVKSEGREESYTQTLLLELGTTETTLSKQLNFQFPATVVSDSLRAQVTVTGDLLVPSISGLSSLIQMPYGCGEQNMINFAPNIYVLQYLNRTGKVDAETRTKALSYMKQGYERELTYQRSDGSFSAFGQSDTSGSTWLSAFVLRCFLQARGFILIDSSVLTKTAMWLSTQQQPDGSFKEPGRVIHTELQGGLDGPLSLTAYVVIALLEDKELTSLTNLTQALKYLSSSLDKGISSNYSLCLVTYALSLAKQPSASKALDNLMNRANMQGGVPMWSSNTGGLSNSWQPRSTTIEIASYVLLSMNELGQVEKGLPLMKWLSQQRSHLGGYGSTQDTVIALQALSTFAAKSSTTQDLTITVNTQTATVATFIIDQTNYMLYQSKEIKAENPLQLQISAVGRGFALFQLTTFYNVLEPQVVARRRRAAPTCEGFDLNVDVKDKDTYNTNIRACFRLCENMDLNQTGMAILDVGLLTGFSLAQSGVPISDLVRKVEQDKGHLFLYLDSINKTETCVDIPTLMEFKVAGVKDAVISVYDYYEPRRRTLVGYTSESKKNASVCTFCEGDCSNCKSQASNSASTPQRQALFMSLILILISLVLWF